MGFWVLHDACSLKRIPIGLALTEKLLESALGVSGCSAQGGGEPVCPKRAYLLGQIVEATPRCVRPASPGPAQGVVELHLRV